MSSSTYGRITGEPEESYYTRRLHEANATGLKRMLRSPAHFKFWVEQGEGSTKALEFGKAFHCATLEPDEFERRYCVLPEDAPERPTRAMLEAKGKRSPNSEARVAWWADWTAHSSGRLTLSRADFDACRYMGDSVRRHPIAGATILGGLREQRIRWTCPETGIENKAAIDLFEPDEFAMDLKSCENAGPEAFARNVISYDYDLAQAQYDEALRSIDVRTRAFLFVACESSPPYVVQPYVLDAMAEQRGVARRRRALARQAECLRSGEWPGYSNNLESLSLPAWAFYGLEDQA